MKSRQAIRLNFILKHITKRLQARMPVNSFTMKGVDMVIDWGAFIVKKVPSFVSVEKVNAFGTPAEWVVAGNQHENENVLLYFHGGGYFFGSPGTHRALTWRLSHKAGVKVLSIDYRLLPDHTLEDIWQDALSSYKWLLSEGYNPQNIVIAGDSAGGGLTLSTLFRLRDYGIPLPAAAVLISPFADVSGESLTIQENSECSHMFHKNMMLRVQKYLCERYNASDYYVSPVCGDYKGMPPMFIQVSDTELLYGDSLLVREKAEKAGVEVRYRELKDMPHVLAVFCSMVPEARDAASEIADFIKEKLNISATEVHRSLKN